MTRARRGPGGPATGVFGLLPKPRAPGCTEETGAALLRSRTRGVSCAYSPRTAGALESSQRRDDLVEGAAERDAGHDRGCFLHPGAGTVVRPPEQRQRLLAPLGRAVLREIVLQGRVRAWGALRRQRARDVV